MLVLELVFMAGVLVVVVVVVVVVVAIVSILIVHKNARHVRTVVGKGETGSRGKIAYSTYQVHSCDPVSEVGP